MAYDFYVIEGKKLIDYKPTEEHYKRAFIRYCERLVKNPEIFTETKDKALFLMIKMIGKESRNIEQQDEEFVYDMFEILQLVNALVGKHTPREFMRLFPIEKEYDGDKYGVKDYFYSMDYAKKIGIDKPIGGKASKFLMEYCNRDIDFYMVTWMEIVSAMDVIQTGRDSMMDFFEENGLHFKTFHKEGNEMVDSETGERFEIVKPRNPMRKLFSIV